MKKFIIAIIAMTSPLFSCNQCLKYYLEQELYDSEVILDDMLDSEVENEDDIIYFFFMLGRNNALYETRMQLDRECKADLHDQIIQGDHVYKHDDNCFCHWKIGN